MEHDKIELTFAASPKGSEISFDILRNRVQIFVDDTMEGVRASISRDEAIVLRTWLDAWIKSTEAL